MSSSTTSSDSSDRSSGLAPPGSFQNYLVVVIAMTAGLCAFVAAFSAWIDPMWIFEHSHAWNRYQTSVNQRIQKTNYLYFGDHDYDSVLLGSSRCTTLREGDFSGMRLFNYSQDSMRPYEYEGLLGNFRSIMGPPKNILIGMDFFATGVGEGSGLAAPEDSLEDARSFFYVPRTLVSLDTFGYAIRSMLLSADPMGQGYWYDRNNTLTILEMAPARRKTAIRRQIEFYRRNFFGPDYDYQGFGAETLLRIRNRYPQANLTVFIPPISIGLYCELLASGRFEDYARWLSDLVSTGVGVMDMLGANEFSEDPDNFLDAHHFKTDRSQLIAKTIQQKGRSDFGHWVGQDNLRRHLARQHRDAERYAKLFPDRCAPRSP